MSLRDAPLLYVFYETCFFDAQREFFERIVGLPVIENQFHPPHERHGLVKYDGGQLILSLNLNVERTFQVDASDGLVTVVTTERAEEITSRLGPHSFARRSGSSDVFTDACGHHYTFRFPSRTSRLGHDSAGLHVPELHLIVNSVATSIPFYAEILDLALKEHTVSSARFATGTVDLILTEGEVAPDGRPTRHDTYLLVFHTGNIDALRETLVQRGLIFKGKRVGISDIGGTARFTDPDGHTFCLYQPSDESLTWGSGGKVKELAMSRDR